MEYVPKSTEKLVSEKTKAIMPHRYTDYRLIFQSSKELVRNIQYLLLMMRPKHSGQPATTKI